MIRKATPSDNKQIAKLYYLIWKDMELDIVKEISEKRMINLLELSIVNVHYRTYYKNISIIISFSSKDNDNAMNNRNNCWNKCPKEDQM